MSLAEERSESNQPTKAWSMPSASETPALKPPTSVDTIAPDRDPARWQRRYTRVLRIVDAVVVSIAMLAAHFVRFDSVNASPDVAGGFQLAYLQLSALIAVAWFVSLGLSRSRDERVVGIGPTEFVRLFHGSWQLFAGIAILAYLLKVEVARGYLAVAFPLGTVLLIASRYVMREQLHKRRKARRAGMHRVLVIGNANKAAALIKDLTADRRAGFDVVGVCLPEAQVGRATRIESIPVYGEMHEAAAVAKKVRADVVAVTGADAITSQVVRELGWALEGTSTKLVMVPALTDVAGPRMITSPVSGMTLVFVDAARFSGPKYIAKSVVDWLTALVITVLISPVLLAIAAAVKLTSKGPVFYRQERVGLDGKTFKMLKFRSMVPDAHARLAEVLAAEGVTDVGMFYKPKNDPRVTPVGRFLRRYSLDELPQLLNVLKGEMSLVGPRPQIDAEVAQYDHVASRRLLVKPGLSGLWQVSGRSDLSPEEGIRMDVYYVENWTVFGDFLILLRTAKAMIAGEGAY